MQKYALNIFRGPLFFQIKSLITLKLYSKSLILLRIFDRFTTKKETAHTEHMSRRFCVKDAETSRDQSTLTNLIISILMFSVFFMQMKNIRKREMFNINKSTSDNGRYGYKNVTKQTNLCKIKTKSYKNTLYNIPKVGGSDV